jgi:iron(III) transport system permease protein
VSFSLARPADAARTADEHWAVVLAGLLALAMAVFIAAPLFAILAQALRGPQGEFVGLTLLTELLTEPRLRDATVNSVAIAIATTAVVLPLAFGFAFALTRSRLPGRGLLRVLALAPLLAPSLMPAISLVYLFGNQGLLKSWLEPFGLQLYGPSGIVLGEAIYTFPHALLILVTALSLADARLYEAAEALGAGRLRRLLTITLPNARYGLMSAGLVVFTLVVTDFGVPKVVGGSFNVLALEAYKQVVGQQNFAKGAAVGLLLLAPAVLSFGLERWLARSHSASLGGRSVAFRPAPNAWRDAGLALLCVAVVAFLLALLGTAVAASFIKLWPYDLTLSLNHYQFDQMDGGGWGAFFNSLKLAGGTMLAGVAIVFVAAYLAEKTPVPAPLAALIRSLALLPMAVPGLVLGLGYIFSFNAPGHPLHALYGTLTLMVAATVAHFYTTAHLTLATALRQLDPEIEAVSRSLRRPWWRACGLVTLPMCLPALLDVARFLFVSAMTTVSAVVFLYTPDTMLASVSVLAMDDAGDTAPAAAMATLVVAASLVATLLLHGVGHLLERRTQSWRNR